MDMAKYTPEGICAYYLTTEEMADSDIAKRLDIFMDAGCSGLRAAVDGDRI